MGAVDLGNPVSLHAWTPAHLSGCIRAYEANRTRLTGGAAVSPWLDRMQQGNLTGANAPQLSSVQGRRVVQFDALNDWLSTGPAADLNFGTGDFSLLAQFYSDGTVTLPSSIFNKFRAAGDAGYVLGHNAGGRLVAFFGAAAADITTPGAHTSAGWRTVAVVRQGDAGRLYVNNTLEGSAAGLALRSCSSTVALHVHAQNGVAYPADLAYAGLWLYSRVLSVDEIRLAGLWRSY